jgi:cytidine deaminase
MDPLLSAALAARALAYAPYSKFHVGAALEAEDGVIYTGGNVENASYGLTICAERAAAFRAVAEGARRFRRVAVAADTVELTPPCGACRQVLWELCRDVEIVLVNLRGETRSFRLRELLPHAFDATFLSDTVAGGEPSGG